MTFNSSEKSVFKIQKYLRNEEVGYLGVLWGYLTGVVLSGWRWWVMMKVELEWVWQLATVQKTRCKRLL